MSVIHSEPHPLAGRTVTLADTPTLQVLGIAGGDAELEDWWDRVAGKSWMDCDGNPAALHYAIRGGVAGHPTNNDVVYVKVGNHGHIVHSSELEAGVPT